MISASSGWLVPVRHALLLPPLRPDIANIPVKILTLLPVSIVSASTNTTREPETQIHKKATARATPSWMIRRDRATRGCAILTAEEVDECDVGTLERATKLHGGYCDGFDRT